MPSLCSAILVAHCACFAEDRAMHMQLAHRLRENLNAFHHTCSTAHNALARICSYAGIPGHHEAARRLFFGDAGDGDEGTTTRNVSCSLAAIPASDGCHVPKVCIRISAKVTKLVNQVLCNLHVTSVILHAIQLASHLKLLSRRLTINYYFDHQC